MVMLEVVNESDSAPSLLRFENSIIYYSRRPKAFRLINKSFNLTCHTGKALNKQIILDSIEDNVAADSTYFNRAFFAGDQFTDGNMAHIVFDHLYRAWNFTNVKEKVDCYIFYDTAWDWAKQIIKILLPSHNIYYQKPFQILEVGELIAYSDSFSKSPYVPNNHFNHPANGGDILFTKTLNLGILQWLSNNSQNTTDEIYPNKIFITRSKTVKSRPCKNNQDVENIFKKEGFTVIDFQYLSVFEQLKYTSQCKVLAGYHGAGLCNLIALNPRAIVVEILGPQPTNAYKIISNSMGLKYYNCLAVSNINQSRRLPWVANLKEIRKVLGKINEL